MGVQKSIAPNDRPTLPLSGKATDGPRRGRRRLRCPLRRDAAVRGRGWNLAYSVQYGQRSSLRPEGGRTQDAPSQRYLTSTPVPTYASILANVR